MNQPPDVLRTWETWTPAFRLEIIALSVAALRRQYSAVLGELRIGGVGDTLTEARRRELNRRLVKISVDIEELGRLRNQANNARKREKKGREEEVTDAD